MTENESSFHGTCGSYICRYIFSGVQHFYWAGKRAYSEKAAFLHASSNARTLQWLLGRLKQ